MLSAAWAQRLAKPYLLVDLRDAPDPAAINAWIAERGIRVLNVAGPRESTCPGIYGEATALLAILLQKMTSG